MNLVEQHIINKSHRLFKEIDDLSFKSKNLYNAANYLIRQEFTKNKEYLNYNKIDLLIKNKDFGEFDNPYKDLPAKVSQQILKNLDKNWLSFFKSIKDWKKNKSKYKGMPSIPKYKKKESGRNILIYTIQAISKSYFKKNNKIKLSKSNIVFNTKVNYKDLKQVRITSKYDHYVIEVVYNKEEIDNGLNEENVMGIDIGMNNLCAVSTTKKDFFLINGKPVKSINHYYNKELAEAKSKLEKENKKKTSFFTRKLTNKRNRKIKHYLHKASKYLIHYCLTNDIGKIIIGKNEQWKTEINLGKKTNQNFVQIPHAMLINQIQYKAELQGITVLLQEESYTSECSFIDNEEIKKHDDYKGKRIKRGLFKTKEKYLINSDINGSLNIIRKAISNFAVGKNEIQDFVVSPKLVTL